MKTTTFIVLSFVLLLVSCRKSKPELRIDESPCELDKPIVASFWIGQSVDKVDYLKPCGPWEPALDGDTIIPRDYGVYNQGGFLYFTADIDCYDELEWIIGNDPQHRFGKQIYVQFFSADVSGLTIPITLIAKKEPNLLCNPNDDGIDTLTRNIYFDPAPSNIYGHFLGNNIGENPVDECTVWIKDQTYNPYIAPPQSDIVGLPRGCSYSCVSYPFIELKGNAHRMNTFCGESSINGTFWDCPNSGACPHVEGIIDYSADYDTVTITYHYADDVTQPNEGGNSIHKVFVGVRQ